jgi:hypothetical protein
MASKTKICSRCGKRKPLGAFYKQAGGAHGRRSDASPATRNLSERVTPEIRKFRSAGGRSSSAGAMKG